MRARCIEHVEAQSYSFESLKAFTVPQALGVDWRKLTRADARRSRSRSGSGRARCTWCASGTGRTSSACYEHFHTRLGDLDQLELLSGQYPSRERFLTELTLDPPNATSDLAGTPVLDEDYLVLSTIHSAKGMEWDTVYLLNVVDGSFPSEFSTGKPELIEEERRLLYVAHDPRAERPACSWRR